MKTTVAALLARHSRASYEDKIKIESMVILADAVCTADIAAKWNFLHDSDLLDEKSCLLRRLVAAVLQRDVDRVGASIPELEAEGIIPRRSSAA